jgi:hypothetical protein
MQSLTYLEKKAFSSRYGDYFFTFSFGSTVNSTSTDACWCIVPEIVLYSVEVKRGSSTWTVQRRFSQFETLLHEVTAMVKSSPDLRDVVLPELPPKKLFIFAKDPEFIKARAAALFEFLEALTVALSRKHVILGSPLDQFLEITKS